MDVLEPSSASSSSSRSLVRRSRAGGQQLVAPLRIDLSACKYELLRLVAARLGWQVVPAGSPDSQWDLFWTDTSISQERLLRLASTQRINHFHGMLELCRKRSMARLLAGLAAAAPPSCSYDFFPATWQLPGQLDEFLAAAKAAGRKATFIVKPDAGCQGKGIKLLQGGSEAAVLRNLAGMATLQAVTQAYIPQPLLIHGLKFDLRVYVLVADVDPLRVFIYKEGLVRFCTAPYSKPTSKNLGCAYMHLTNYAVNKHNAEAFVSPGSSGNGRGTSLCAADSSSGDEAEGDQAPAQQQHREGGPASGVGAGGDSASKWSFSQLRQHLESQGYSWSGLWSSISQLVVKSLAAATPHLAATYRTTVVSKDSSGIASRPGGAASGTSSCSSQRGSSSAPAAASSAAVAAGGCRCFEVLGYDVLLDAALKPWLVEVNHSPSFNIDSPLDRSIKEALITDAVRLLRIEPGSIAAAKQAARKAAQARLVAPPPARGSSSAAGSPVSSGCSADVKAAQQAHRNAIIAARDKWQDRHLGNFERIYPVPMPGQQSGASKAGAAAAATTSPAKLAELAQLQHTFDQLLAVSQQLYSQQQLASKSPVRNRSQQQSPGCMKQQQQREQQVDSCRQLMPSTKPQAQQQQDAEEAVQPAQLSCDDSEGDEQGCARGQLCSDTGQHVSVESALALLTAALARPDAPPQHRSRPASASSVQQISRNACSFGRPQSVRATCSSSGKSSANSTTRLQSAEICKLSQQHTASVQHLSQSSSVLHTFRSNTSSTSTSSNKTNGSSRSTLCAHVQGSTCRSSAAAAQHQVAARPRPASARRLRGCRGDVSSSSSTSSSTGDVGGDETMRPWSSRCSRRGSWDASNNKGDSVTSVVGAGVGSSRQHFASLQQAITATHQNISSDSCSRIRRSNSCSRVRQTKVAAANTAAGSVHCTGQNTNTGTPPHSIPPAPPLLALPAAVGSGVQQHSSCDKGSRMSLIAAAVQEATAALDAAVTATCSNVTTPRSAALSMSGLAAGELDCTAGQQPQNVHSLECSAVMNAAHGLTKGPLQSTMHSTLIGAAEQWHHQEWHLQQQRQQQCGLLPASSSVNRSPFLERFSSFPGSREQGSRQVAPTISRTAVLEKKSSSHYINSLLQQHQAGRGVAPASLPAAANGAASWGSCAVPSANCQQRQGVQCRSSKGAAASGLLGVHSEGRQHAAGGPRAGPVLQLPGSTCSAEGMAGAVVLGSSIQSGGQHPLLRHCSTGGLLGRLRLADASTNAA